MESGCVCHDFLRLALTSPRDYIQAGQDEIYNIQRSFSLDERESIRASAQNCQLCQKIHEYLQYFYGLGLDLPDEENRQLMEIRMYSSLLSGHENLISSISFFGNEQRNPEGLPPRINLSAWADQGMLLASLL